MKISNNVLLKVEESDIINGVLNIPDEVTGIGHDAIYNLSTLREVYGKNVKTVGNRGICRCDSLTSVNLPKAQTFGDYCFRSCDSLTSITLPKAQTFGDYCFSSCDSLTSVALPSAQTFGDFCFCFCDSLTSVALPNAKTFGDFCFRSCDSLTSVALPSAQTFGDYCFRSCDSLTSIILPNAKTFGYFCFRSCDSLTSVDGKRAACIDSYPMVVESETTKKRYTILSGTWINRMEEGQWIGNKVFVAQKDGFSAHGEAAKQAIQDVEFKILTEKMKSEPLGMDDVVTIPRYRAITGACQVGVEKWMQDNNLSATEIKVKDLLPLLESTQAYGVGKFKQLIQKGGSNA